MYGQTLTNHECQLTPWHQDIKHSMDETTRREIRENKKRTTSDTTSSVEQRHIIGHLRVGNAYVNRNQIGAVVGVQPFGGRGLSGTGPKAGGPITLFRYAEERVVSVNTTAAGGNAALLGSDQN